MGTGSLFSKGALSPREFRKMTSAQKECPHVKSELAPRLRQDSRSTLSLDGGVPEVIRLTWID